MENRTAEENEARLIRAQLESIARLQKSQVEVFEKISSDLKEIRVAMVLLVIIFVLALMVFVYRFALP